MIDKVAAFAFELSGPVGGGLQDVSFHHSFGVRSVLERRSELATLRAIGFNPSRIGKLILLENCLLLLGGIMVGGVTAIVCVTAPLLQNAQFTELLQPLAWLGVVIVVGLVAGSFAVRTAARQPLLSALRQR